MDNSYLFDMASGVVLATDNRHRNDATMEQVTEYLSRFLQFREIYKCVLRLNKSDVAGILGRRERKMSRQRNQTRRLERSAGGRTRIRRCHG